MQKMEGVTPADRRLRKAWLLTALLSALVMILGLTVYDQGRAVMQNYLFIPIFALVGIGVYRGDYKADRVYCAGLLFTAWYALTRMLNGDRYLQFDYNQYRIISMLATYGLAFPMAAVLDDAKGRRALDRITLVLTAAMAVICWIGAIAALQGRLITGPVFGSQFGTATGLTRLTVLSQNSNFTAAFSMCGLFMLIYWVAGHWRLWLLAPAVVAGAGFLIAFFIADSRGALMALVLGLLITVVVLFQRLPISDRRRRMVGALCLAGAVVLALTIRYVVTDKAVGAVPKSLLFRESYRAWLFEAALNVFTGHPLSALKGFDELEMMSAINRYAPANALSHMHNSYLQTLMLTGAPGLLMALWLSWRVLSSSVRILFSKSLSVSPIQKLIILPPATLFVHGMLEHYLFVDSYSILNFLFFLFAGYVVRLGSASGLEQEQGRITHCKDTTTSKRG